MKPVADLGAFKTIFTIRTARCALIRSLTHAARFGCARSGSGLGPVCGRGRLRGRCGGRLKAAITRAWAGLIGSVRRSEVRRRIRRREPPRSLEEGAVRSAVISGGGDL